MGDSISLARQHKKMANYLNQYLREVDEHLPDDIDGVTDEHMEGKHLKNFLENFGNWLARTSFETKQTTLLGNKSMEEYFNTAKEVLKLKFSEPIHVFVMLPSQTPICLTLNISDTW
jgi:hypothetical protein